MKKLTAYNPENDRQIEQMVGKAMCAYANWQSNDSSAGICNDKKLARFHANMALIDQGEYEATVRCIAMFVKDSVPTICTYVIDRCKSKLGI